MTVVATSMPTAAGELHGVELYAWIFAGYMLASTVMVPIFGKLADLYGRKPVLLTGLVVFLLGSGLCGAATSMRQLILFRVLQGLGAGAVTPTALTIVGDLFTLEQRARVQGLVAAVWGVAGLTGPAVGGYIVKWLSWRWVFLLNLPFGLLSAVIVVLAYHERVARRRRKLDVAGALTLAAAVLTLLYGVQRGGRAWPVLLLAAALAATFVVIEGRATEPLLPLALFRRRVMVVASVAGTLIGAAMFSVTTFVALYVQTVLGRPATVAGAVITPMMVGWPIASTLSGRLLPRVGFRPLVRVGFLICALGAGGLALTLTPGHALLWSRVALGMVGVGLGLANTALVIAVQTTSTWSERGVATSSTMFFRSIGGTVAVGTLGGILAAGLTSGQSKLLESLLGPHRPGEAALEPAARQALGHALESSLGLVLWILAGVALAAFVVGLFFPKLSGKQAPVTPGEVDAEAASP
ncbi:MAG: MFS transporter [Deltaproteobacteria bacterium]|nr:MFS transporter [Deltaproteobacteria bacterium]